MVAIVETDLCPDALALARALEGRPGLCLLFSPPGSGVSFLASDPVETRHAWCPEPELPLDATQGVLGRVPRWVGALPYEARRDLERAGYVPARDLRPEPQICRAVWQRYTAVARIGERVDVIADDALSAGRLIERLRRTPPSAEAGLSLLGSDDSDAEHAARIAVALEHIARGDLYQVNVARRFRLEAWGSPVELLGRLSRAADAPYSGLLEIDGATLLSTSPELALELDAVRRVWTQPIKGTRPRSADPAIDQRLAEELDADPKERAELAMVIDVERNDLGRIAVPGSVILAEPPHVRSFGNVHHRLATLGARLAKDVDRAALLRAMLPSGSVTGAPKRRAMELIHHLEPHRRGLYTGAFGALTRDGGLTLAMAIRTLTIKGGEAHYFAGGGIVADSDPAREVAETYWKAEQITRLIQKQVRPASAAALSEALE